MNTKKSIKCDCLVAVSPLPSHPSQKTIVHDLLLAIKLLYTTRCSQNTLLCRNRTIYMTQSDNPRIADFFFLNNEFCTKTAV